MFNRIYHPRLWPWVSFRRLSKLPGQPGLYAIRSWGPLGPIQYIGESKNLYNRWNRTGRYEHHRKKQAKLLPFGVLNYYPVENHEYWETQLINTLGRPPWNWQKRPHNSYLGAIWWGLKRTKWRHVFILWFVLTLLGVFVIEYVM